MLAWKPHQSLFALAFSPDGLSLATSGTGPTLCVSDALTAQPRWDDTWSATAVGLGVAYSPDGQHIACIGWNAVRLYDAPTGRYLGQLPARGYPVTFTPDSTGLTVRLSAHIQVVTYDRAVPIVKGRIIERFVLQTGPRAVNRLAWSADGRFLAVLSEGALHLFWGMGRNEFADFPHTNTAAGAAGLAFHPDGKTLFYSVGPKLVVFDLDTRKPVHQWQPSKKHVQDAAFTPNGKHLLTVSNDATVVLWETAGWTEARAFAWKIGKLKAVAVSPDGTRAACGSDRGQVVLWDLDV